jgi:hypothetical protein
MIRNITLAILIATITGIPAMACAIPAQPMTAAEHECCRRMSHDCGSMTGSSMHECCRVQVRSSSPFVAAGHFTMERNAPVHYMAVVAPFLGQAWRNSAPVTAISHSPPLLKSAVLRI